MSELKKQFDQIDRLLVKRFGLPFRKEKLPDPLDMLIGTILSQNTNDKNSFKAYSALKEKYPDWNQLSKIPKAAIEKIINVAGLAKQKSAAIKDSIRHIEKSKGKISLDYVKDLSEEEAIKDLTSINGVGVKTASCVLLFSLDRNVCPVDTHVHRTLNRLGLVDTKAPDKTFEAVTGNIPKGKAHRIHTNLIRLGREICKPSKPRCKICPVLEVCKFEEKNMEEGKAGKENKFFLLDEI